MSVTVVRTILANRIWELIEANATVAAAVRVGNRAKLSTARGWLKALMGNKAPGDFPQLIVSYGPWYYDSFSRTPRYSHRTTPNPSGEGKELGQAIRITATYRDARADVNDPVDIAVIEAVEAGGEGLGLMPATLPYCIRGRIDATTDYNASVAPDGLPPQQSNSRRQQTVFTVPLVVRWMGNTFPTA
jgi:hypothetical protein